MTRVRQALLCVIAVAAVSFAVATVVPAVSIQQPAVQPNSAGSVSRQITPEPVDANAMLDCLGCHGPGAKPPPYLAGELFHKRAHAGFTDGAHAKAGATGGPSVGCLDCHSPDGTWDAVFPASDSRSTVSRPKIQETCGRCHQEPATSFLASIHGHGQARGINVAATCVDCHSSHAVFRSSDPRSNLNRTSIAETCAKCHSGILQDFGTSSHFEALARGDSRAPVCTTCHKAVSHAVAPATMRDFDIGTVDLCKRCHEAQAPSYRDTFHGKASALGFKPAATCVDCHTPHRNLPASDPRSSVNRANIVQTCARCHEGATASFATYDPHVEVWNPDRSRLIFASYAFMVVLFSIVFGFFGLHTLLWLQRSIVGLIRGETRRIRDGEQWVVRFSMTDRVTHIVVVVSFIVLAATGLPIMFSYTQWGHTLSAAMGGLPVTRVLHRVFAVVTFGYGSYHIGYLLWLRFGKGARGIFFGPESMMPRWRDFTDLYHMLRWFLYIDRKPPRLDRWTYWEKFDYFAVFWGIPVIGFSGLMLWIPGVVTRLLPGSFLNVAAIVHGEEALLAVGFIFAFHFFHNHMRPENFPLDTVVFTGRMPLERLREERPLEYGRLEAEGRLESLLADPPTRRERLFASVFGYSAYAIGLVLVVTIFWTMFVAH